MDSFFAYIIFTLFVVWIVASLLWFWRCFGDRALTASEARAVKELRPLAEFTRIEVVPNVGRTVFATESIPAFTAVGLYDGRKTTPALFLKKQKALQDMPAYHWCLPGGSIIDPTEPDGTLPDDTVYRSAFINEPPSGMSINILPLVTKNYVWLFSAREIEKGEELYINYGTRYQRDYDSEMRETVGKVAVDIDQVTALVRVANERQYLKKAVRRFLPADYRDWLRAEVKPTKGYKQNSSRMHEEGSS
jgi:hypothetical protein